MNRIHNHRRRNKAALFIFFLILVAIPIQANVFLKNPSSGGGVDTNESVRYNNTVAVDCQASFFVRGIHNNGSLFCAADQTGASASGKSAINPWLYNFSTTMGWNESQGNLSYVEITGDTMTGPLLNTDGTYTVTINGTTISSDTAYAPLIQLGVGSIADSSYSIAMGIDAHSHAISGVAIGSGASALGVEGSALVAWASAGYRAVSIGYAASASGDMSTAGGEASWARGNNSVAIGQQVIAYGRSSLAMGYLSRAEGDYSASIGTSTNASGDYSYAFGRKVVVGGDNSYGFGSDGNSTQNNLFSLHNLNLNVSGDINASKRICDKNGCIGFNNTDTNESTRLANFLPSTGGGGSNFLSSFAADGTPTYLPVSTPSVTDSFLTWYIDNGNSFVNADTAIDTVDLLSTDGWILVGGANTGSPGGHGEYIDYSVNTSILNSTILEVVNNSDLNLTSLRIPMAGAATNARLEFNGPKDYVMYAEGTGLNRPLIFLNSTELNDFGSIIGAQFGQHQMNLVSRSGTIYWGAEEAGGKSSGTAMGLYSGSTSAGFITIKNSTVGGFDGIALVTTQAQMQIIIKATRENIKLIAGLGGNISLSGNVINLTSTTYMDNDCGIPFTVLSYERTSPASNSPLSMGNGDLLQGSPQACSGTVTAIAGACENCNSGVTEIAMELRINGASQVCDVPQLTSAYDTDSVTCDVDFSQNDRIGCYHKTETGAVTGTTCSIYVRYD